MYVQVRTIDGKRNVLLTVSKLTTVPQFKKMIQEEMDVSVDKQRLFFRGKQLEDEYKIFDYNINLNDVVQLMIKIDLPVASQAGSEEAKSNCESEILSTPHTVQVEDCPCESKYFKIGDYVDVKDVCYGAWFEGRVTGIFKDTTQNDTSDTEDQIYYKVTMDTNATEPNLLVNLKEVRPRARHVISPSDLNVGDMVMVNYNIEEPDDRGYWYDMKITDIVANGRSKPQIKGTLFVGTENTQLDNCLVVFINEIMKIEPVKLMSERTEEELEMLQTDTIKKRSNAPICSRCNDNPRRKCKDCSCSVCGGKNDPEKQILCDECDMAFHISCLNPPLSEVPDSDEWFCRGCKNDTDEIVKAGEKLKESKKRGKLASVVNNTTRDWGKGMACVGRTKECSLVPPNHFGPIPGVEVGTAWKFRVQVSEAGVHRPHVAGISGREGDGAYSLVLSGGYEDDVDNGDEFFYTGSGGRDLSGNKRVALQSSDQQLTRMNKALALNCNAPLNEKGAEAKKWKDGKPVRVVRNFKLAKHSKYAPEDGNRYDGIYKVVKYYPEKGKSGFIVWRYLLRRDDPTPAPWTKAGKERMKALGLELQYPDGYLDALERNEKENSQPGGKNLKRKSKVEDSQESPKAKKPYLTYVLEPQLEKEINQDTQNEKLWNTVKGIFPCVKKDFLSKVEDSFMCICCQELVYRPVTTPCLHNICMTCLKRSFEAKVFTCPYCRTELGNKFDMEENKHLQEALLFLFPGYSTGRN